MKVIKYENDPSRKFKRVTKGCLDLSAITALILIVALMPFSSVCACLSKASEFDMFFLTPTYRYQPPSDENMAASMKEVLEGMKIRNDTHSLFAKWKISSMYF